MGVVPEAEGGVAVAGDGVDPLLSLPPLLGLGSYPVEHAARPVQVHQRTCRVGWIMSFGKGPAPLSDSVLRSGQLPWEPSGADR